MQLEDHSDGNDLHRAVRVFTAPSTAHQQVRVECFSWVHLTGSVDREIGSLLSRCERNRYRVLSSRQWQS